MKICHIITKSEPGGAQAHLIELSRGLTKIGYDIEVATGEPGDLVDRLTEMGIIVKIIPTVSNKINPLKDIIAIRNLIKWLKTANPDIVHLHSTKAGLLGRIAAYSVHIPSIFTAHGWAFTDGASFTRKAIAKPIEWLAGHLCKNVICVSKYDYELAIRHNIIEKSKLHIVHNGISDIELPVNRDDKSELQMIMVARFAQPKQQKQLINTLSQWGERNWKLTFAGDGPELQACKRLANELGISEKIEFPGTILNIPEKLRNSDVLLLISRYEGLPISIIEAMRAGLPVIASDVGGVSELVDKDVGILVQPGDETSLLDALNEIASAPSTLKTMGQKARSKFQRDFRADTMVEKIAYIYNNTIKNLDRQKVITSDNISVTK